MFSGGIYRFFPSCNVIKSKTPTPLFSCKYCDFFQPATLFKMGLLRHCFLWILRFLASLQRYLKRYFASDFFLFKKTYFTSLKQQSYYLYINRSKCNPPSPPPPYFYSKISWFLKAVKTYYIPTISLLYIRNILQIKIKTIFSWSENTEVSLLKICNL